jgi:protocatechuate 3,4-dioxygenase beta subunit
MLYSLKNVMNDRLVEKTIAVQGLSRRKFFGLLVAGTAASFLGCRRVKRSREPTVSLAAIVTADAAVLPSCVLRPEQTEGPYFIDEQLNRSDIRVDPSDGSVRPGVPLRVTFHVSRISGTSCSPLSGAIVDVWQCDALGVYSDVRDMNVGFDTRGKKFLRGYQTTDANGIAEFLTIYPGWYEGRTVHIHFKIRNDPGSRRAQEFISQLYFDESITDQVHKQSPYNGKGYRAATNDKDFIFRRGGKELIPTLTKEGHGYAATFNIGLQLN